MHRVTDGGRSALDNLTSRDTEEIIFVSNQPIGQGPIWSYHDTIQHSAVAFGHPRAVLPVPAESFK